MVCRVAGCPLTPTEYETLLLVMRGRTYQQAARERGVSPSSVRSTLNSAYRRLGLSGVVQAAALMLREGWVGPDKVLEDYDGRPYSLESQLHKLTENWLPTPAQRLYLDAFDELLRERSDEAVEAVDFAFGVLCWERGCPDRRRDVCDIDAMLLGMARALMRPISVAA